MSGTRILFLDFDGVLNTENYHTQLQAEGKSGWDDFCMLFDPAAVTNLKRILDAVPDVRIVVESSWKVNGLDELRLMWAERGLSGTLYDITSTFFCEELLTADLSVPDSVRKIDGIGKGREIRAWLRRHTGPNCRYVILDDMAEFDGELRDHAIRIDPWVGITESDAVEAVMILNESEGERVCVVFRYYFCGDYYIKIQHILVYSKYSSIFATELIYYMNKRKHNHETLIEAVDLTFLRYSFNPTIGMVAELMGVSTDVIEEWLEQEHITLVYEDRLTDEAIEFLAHKYVARLHRYFINCEESWPVLDDVERDLFNQFKRKYGRTLHFWVKEWKDIDQVFIIKDFKNALEKKAQETFFPDFCFLETPSINGSADFDFQNLDYCFSQVKLTENSILLSAISHSLYYGARLKTKLPAPPICRKISLEIIQENRFHIFTEDSDNKGHAVFSSFHIM